MTEQNDLAVHAAETYESFLVPALFEPWARVLLDRSGIKPGDRVLDVACGTGAVARKAATMVGPSGTVAALDANPAMIVVARSRAADFAVHWREGDALSLPYPDASFDLVICQQGLQFFPDQTAALREMRRVLTPGGRVAISVWQSLEQNALYAQLNDAIVRLIGVPAFAAPFSLGDSERLRTLLGEAGFSEVDIRPEVQSVRLPSPGEFVRLSISAAAAAVPAFAAMDGPARESLIGALQEDVQEMLQTHVVGDELVEQTAAFIVTARP